MKAMENTQKLISLATGEGIVEAVTIEGVVPSAANAANMADTVARITSMIPTSEVSYRPAAQQCAVCTP